MTSLPVIAYHALADARTPIAVAPRRFAATMQAMREAGWRSLAMHEVLAGLRHGEWPARSFALHFDDGFQSVRDHAVPVLDACGFTATVFVVASWVGRTNDWPTQPPGVPRWPLMDWDDLASLVGRGWTMGAHTCSHAHLPDLSIADQRRELDESAAVIASRVGVRPQALAYPYGRSSAETMQLAAQYYQAAFGTRLDFITGRSDAMHLERIDAYYLTPRLAATLDAPATRAYLGVRRLAREWLRRR